MNIKKIVYGTVFFVAGFVASTGMEFSIAQDANVESAWEVQSSAFGQQSFYVVKHNRVTGETLILSVERGNAKKWLRLPVEDKSR